MKGIVIFTILVTVTSAQVVFPDTDTSSGGDSNNSDDVDSQLISAFISLDEDDRSIPSNAPNGDSSCFLPNGPQGNCIRFSQCAAYREYVISVNNPAILNFLRSRVCKVETTAVFVCCPVTNEPLKTGPQVSSGSQNSPFPTSCGQPFADRIILGTEVNVGAYPWLVAIGSPRGRVFDTVCGGTLITRRHVLSAAHCFSQDGSSNLTHVRVGEHDVTSDRDGANPQERRISNVRSDDFTKTTLTNDITILTLDRDVSFNRNIKPICLPFRSDLRHNKFEGNTLDIAGWGRTTNNSRRGSPVPLEAKVKVERLGECQQKYRNHIRITERQLCAGTGGADSCNGDSGGPLHYVDQQSGKFYLVGVTSFGIGCGRSDFLGVYTRVGSYLDWIETNVN